MLVKLSSAHASCVLILCNLLNDCPRYGIEVGRDGHAQLQDTDVCFTECALMCEGHMALTSCSIFANVSAWHGRALFRSLVAVVCLPANHC